MKKASNAKMMTVALCGGLLIATTGCTSFNRDALWNACINETEYCTYYMEDFPVGSKFVHRQDDWTDKRLKKGYELKIMSVDGDEARLEHGWQVLRELNGNVVSVEDNQKSARAGRLCTRPIIVKVLNPSNLKVGAFFTEYGQYLYDKDIPYGGGKIPYLIQENTCQDLVAEPYPFIYLRKKDEK